MEQIVQFIVENSRYAPWMVLGLVLLAGCNVPISIDVVVILSAFLAATIIPEHTFILYLSVLVGCYFSAWIAYWIGRKIGVRLLRFRYFAKIFTKRRLQKIGAFYEKHGMLTLLIGRFIPFGMRNCIFFTTGISKYSFVKFICKDALACFIWVTLSFSVYYSIGQSYELLVQKIKIVNILIFMACGVVVITLLYYKRYKKRIKALDKNPGLDS